MIDIALDAAMRLIRKKNTPTIPPQGRKLMGGWLWNLVSPSYSGVHFSDYVENGYKKNADVYSAVTKIARAAAGVPVYFVRVDSSGDDQRYYLAELAKLFKEPYPDITFREIVYAYFLDRNLAGESFTYLLRAGSAQRVREFTRMRPDQVSIHYRDANDPSTKYYGYGAHYEIPKEDVIHSRMFDPLTGLTMDGRGMAPLEAAMRMVAMGNAGVDWNTATMQNMGRFSGVMKFHESLTQEQKDAIYRSFEQRHAGKSKAGSVFVTDHDFDYTDLGNITTQKDADWLGAMNLSKQQVASVFGIDSIVIGDKTSSTYNNMEQAYLDMYYNVIIPDLTELQDLLSNRITSTYGEGIELRFDFESIEAIKKAQKSAYDRLQNAWWLTPNERRAELGYEVINSPDMNTVYIPAGQIPISESGFTDPEQ